MSEHYNIGEIINVPFDELMKSQYVDYARDVITSRAIPDIRDGLKPVHRRILVSMNDLGLTPRGAYKKSARTVGDVLGKYHPHGDASVYEAMVILAQDFNTKYPLVDGMGNFGNTDGDPAAAMRYTEAKLSKYGNLLMQDIEKETVEMQLNYDESTYEPTVLPGLFPTLLANGSSGIAVGMASSFAPHKVSDIYKAVFLILNNKLKDKETKIDELIDIVKAPDFPTGGIIVNPEDMYNLYCTGEGKITVRGKYHIEEVNKRNDAIVFTEIPYKVIKARLVAKINEIAKDEIKEIVEVRDESNREGTRIVIEYRKEANLDWIINLLFKRTELQSNFSVKHIALVNNKPKMNLSLKSLLLNFVYHAEDVILNKTKYELAKDKEKIHIVEAIVKVLEDTEKLLKLIKNSKGYKDTVNKIKEEYDFSEKQARAIADLKIYNLNEESIEKYKENFESLIKSIAKYESIIACDKELVKETIKELKEVSKQFAKEERLTEIGSPISCSDEDKRAYIKNEAIVVMLSHNGLIKAVKTEQYNAQKRAGKGVSVKAREDDFVEQLYTLNTHDDLIIATNKGRIVIIPAYEIPIVNKGSSGKYINNYLVLEEDEDIINVLPVKQEYDKEQFAILLTTKNGRSKRLHLDDLPKTKAGASVISFREDEETDLFSCNLVHKDDSILAVTKEGQVLRVLASDISIQGRQASGIWLINIRDNDELVEIVTCTEEDNVALVSEKGYGKQLQVKDIPVKGRRTLGVISYKTSKKTGLVSSATIVNQDETLFIMTKQGMIIRIPTNTIPVLSRHTIGVKVVKVTKNDIVKSIAPAPEESEGYDE